MLRLTCRTCGRRFTAERSTAKFCSSRCRQANYRKAVAKAQGRTGRRQPVLLLCVNCGREFKAKRATAEFCGAGCRQAHYRQVNAKRFEREKRERQRALKTRLPSAEIRRIIEELRR